MRVVRALTGMRCNMRIQINLSQPCLSVAASCLCAPMDGTSTYKRQQQLPALTLHELRTCSQLRPHCRGHLISCPLLPMLAVDACRSICPTCCMHYTMVPVTTVHSPSQGLRRLLLFRAPRVSQHLPWPLRVPPLLPLPWLRARGSSQQNL